MRFSHHPRPFLALLLAVGLVTLSSADAAPPKSTVPTKRPPDRERGRELWLQSCWQCHGEQGKGDGPAAAALAGGVPTLENRVAKENFDALVTLIGEGKGRMPAYKEDIDKHDARRILIYLQDALQGRTEAATGKAEKDEDAAKEN